MSEREYPEVGGETMERPIHAFELACRRAIGEEQRRANPDTNLVGILSDAVRLAREYTRWARTSGFATRGTPRPAASGTGADAS
jgi:hypothetical protein